MPQLTLASASPRRRELLARLERPFQIVVPHADETVPPGMPADIAARLLAERKAENAASRVEAGTIIGADTLVSAGGAIIGKPADSAHAAQILRLLSSAPHYVITGVCLLDARSRRRLTASDTTRVIMRPMSESQIAEYIDSGEPMGKAGAYAIQETGDRFVERVEGSMTNVVGLPMELLERMLKEFEL